MTDTDDTHGIPEHINDEHTDRVTVPVLPPHSKIDTSTLEFRNPPEAPAVPEGWILAGIPVGHSRAADMGGAFRDAWIGLRSCVEDILFSDGELGDDAEILLSVQSFGGEEWPTGSDELHVTVTIDARDSFEISTDEIESKYGAALKAIGVNRIVAVNLPQSVDL